MRRCPTSIFLSFALLAPCAWLRAEPAEKAHLDKILQRRSFTAVEAIALDRDTNSAVDVRDLVLYLKDQNSLGVSASFATAETLAFHSQGSVPLTVNFSKPLPQATTVTFDLGGTASPPSATTPDYTLSYNSSLPAGATSMQLNVVFRPWIGMGGEKVVRLTISRNPSVLPLNGEFGTHILRIRQFDQTEFIGTLTFAAASGLPSLPVRVGLWSGGTGVCSFQQADTIFGPDVALQWSGGSGDFPQSLGNSIPLQFSGESFGRGANSKINARLSLARSNAPYDDITAAYLSGFPTNDLPAVYTATFVFDNLIGAGALYSGGPNNPYAVTNMGRLTLQRVKYAPAPSP